MFTTSITQTILTCLAVLTSMGTLVQDTRVNKAFEVALPINTINLTSNLESLNDTTMHNHVEHVSVDQTFTAMPRIQPRDDHRRYVLAKAPGRHSDLTGGSRILWPSI